MSTAQKKVPDPSADGAGTHGTKHNVSEFAGTTSPRQVRALGGLLRGPLSRESLDRVAGCSNGPDLVADLRAKGLTLPCEFTMVRDRDDRPVRIGTYCLTPSDRLAVLAWLDRQREGQEVVHG